MFKVDELLLLENLTYFPDLEPFFTVLHADGLTVEEYLNKIKYEDIIDDKDYASYMNGFDFKNLIMAIRKNKDILACKILEPHFDQAYGGGGGLSTVFIDEAQDFVNEEILYFKTLMSLKNGRFLVFYDKNQLLTTDSVPEWIEKSECKLLLTKNCRNTKQIAKTAYNAALP